MIGLCPKVKMYFVVFWGTTMDWINCIPRTKCTSKAPTTRCRFSWVGVNARRVKTQIISLRPNVLVHPKSKMELSEKSGTYVLSIPSESTTEPISLEQSLWYSMTGIIRSNRIERKVIRPIFEKNWLQSFTYVFPPSTRQWPVCRLVSKYFRVTWTTQNDCTDTRHDQRAPTDRRATQKG